MTPQTRTAAMIKRCVRLTVPPREEIGIQLARPRREAALPWLALHGLLQFGDTREHRGSQSIAYGGAMCDVRPWSRAPVT